MGFQTRVQCSERVDFKTHILDLTTDFWYFNSLNLNKQRKKTENKQKIISREHNNVELRTWNTINMMHVLISDGEEVFLFQLNTPPLSLFQSSTRL